MGSTRPPRWPDPCSSPRTSPQGSSPLSPSRGRSWGDPRGQFPRSPPPWVTPGSHTKHSRAAHDVPWAWSVPQCPRAVAVAGTDLCPGSVEGTLLPGHLAAKGRAGWALRQAPTGGRCAPPALREPWQTVFGGINPWAALGGVWAAAGVGGWLLALRLRVGPLVVAPVSGAAPSGRPPRGPRPRQGHGDITASAPPRPFLTPAEAR